jgi:hypothetical protein
LARDRECDIVARYRSVFASCVRDVTVIMTAVEGAAAQAIVPDPLADQPIGLTRRVRGRT